MDQPNATSGVTQLKLKHPVALAPGENTIEVVAYNRANLVASNPAAIRVKAQTPDGQPKPRLVVLSVE